MATRSKKKVTVKKAAAKKKIDTITLEDVNPNTIETAKETAPEIEKTKACIVGTASTSLHLAPFGDPEFFVCGLAWRNSAKQADRVYEMHTLDTFRVSVPPNYTEFLNDLVKSGVEVITNDGFHGVKGAKVYPLDDVINFLGGPSSEYQNGDYFMSSIAYAIAHLMYEGWKEIHIYGVDMCADSEYMHQKPNLEYLIGLGRGMGFKIYIPNEAALVKGTHRYGYERPPSEGDITVSDLKKRHAQYEKEWDQARARFYTLDGARQVIGEQLAYLEKRRNGINMGAYSDLMKDKKI